MKTRNYSFLLVLLLLPSVVPTLAQTQQHALKKKIPVWLKQYKVPAVGVAVIKNGKVEWAEVFGERATGVKATRDTIFNVASLTKPVFAMMALQLIARNELNLDESLSEYWIDPDIANDERHRKLTPRIILSHQTGFPNWRRDQKLSFAFEPGTKYQYSGEGMEYLKRAIERKSKKTMPDLVKSLVFEPSGMTSTSFTWNESNESRFAIGYDRAMKPYKIPKRTDPSAADDLLTTIDDYARFVAWVLNGANLSASVFQDMKSPQVKSQKEFNFGLGWQLLIGAEPVLTHGGSDEGVRTDATLLPQSRSGVIILTNSDNGEPLIQLIFEEALEKGSAIQDMVSLSDWHYLEGLSEQELGKNVRQFATSPSVWHRLTRGVEARFFKQSGLSKTEKQEAREAFHSFIGAVMSGTVSKESLNEMLNILFKPKPDGARELNKQLSDSELRVFINLAKAEAHKSVAEKN
ncbi:MAG TPA: serine hydrolase domain-containing protein [Blastocatellia bacterium]|nr:serine hydrolase domain-containing protein [Blastocatellia bacterium]